MKGLHLKNMAFGKRNMSYIHYSVLTIIKKGVKVCQDAQMKGESFLPTFEFDRSILKS